jgi:hypothetical protein
MTGENDQPPLLQDGHHGSHLGFGFCRLSHELLGRLVLFFCGFLGVTSGRLLSMTSTAASMVAILDLVSVDFLTIACRLVISPQYKLQICLTKQGFS